MVLDLRYLRWWKELRFREERQTSHLIMKAMLPSGSPRISEILSRFADYIIPHDDKFPSGKFLSPHHGNVQALVLGTGTTMIRFMSL